MMLTREQLTKAAIKLAELKGEKPSKAPLGRYAHEIQHIYQIIEALAEVLDNADDEAAREVDDGKTH